MPRGSAFFAAHVALLLSLLPNPATLVRALSALPHAAYGDPGGKPRLNLQGRCLLLWRSGVSLARLHGERCTPDLFAGIKKKSTVLQTKCSAFLVENSGIEPLTSCMPCKRSPS